MIFSHATSSKKFNVSILVENLNKMGVSASSNESTDSLISKILDISQGDTRQEIFEGKMIDSFDISCGYFSKNEYCQLVGVVDISYWNKVNSVIININAAGDSTSTDVQTLTINADGWTIEETDTGYKLTKDTSSMSKFKTLDSIGSITIDGDGTTCVNATITASVVMESATTVNAEGSTPLMFAYGATWEVLETQNYTWESLEAINATWETLYAMDSKLNV